MSDVKPEKGGGKKQLVQGKTDSSFLPNGSLGEGKKK